MASDFLNTATQRHMLFLQRLASHEASTFDPYLKKADKIIRDILSQEGEFIDSKSTLDKILKALTEELGPLYAQWGEELLEDMQKIGEEEADFTARMLQKAVTGATVAAASAAAVWTAANLIPVQLSDKGESALMQPLVKQFTPNQVQRVTGVVRNGFYAGTPTQNIITQIRGTKTNQFKDGVLITTKRNASSIARTLTSHVSNIARETTLKKNKNILRGWAFSATLDSRTSGVCIGHDQDAAEGKIWPIGSGPIPPIHLNCRSAQIPVLKSKFDLFKREGTRASKGSKGGAQVRDQGYLTWLKKEPLWFQQEALGKAKAQLFRDGGLTTKQFNDAIRNRLGQPLTLDEIKRKSPDAWRQADLNGE